MYKTIKTFISIFLCITLSISVMPLAFAADDTSVEDSGVEYDNISIGAGGSFFAPLINPTDSNHYVVFSDMNGMYSSFDAGESWERTETLVSFSNACFSEDGSTIYAGSSGLFASHDKGQTLEIIYPHPDTIKTTVSRLGRNDLNILASGDYNNSYVLCVTEHDNRVYFITMSWSSSRQIRLLSCNSDGTELIEYYRNDTLISESPLNQNYKIEVDDTAIYYSDGSNIMKYTFEDENLIEVYTASGTINDFETIDNYFFILDDLDEYTQILYTLNFETFNDLSEKNTLDTSFYVYGIEYPFEWHYTMLSGNSLESIFIVMNSDIDDTYPLNSDLGGVLKFDGTEFSWAYDPVHQTKGVYKDNSWTTYAVDPIYGISCDPSDDSHCLMTNIHTVYDIYFDDEYQDGQMQHCNVSTVDGVNYYSSTGLDCQTTYFVHEDPFDEQHILISTTDIGLQISYDGGTSFRRVEKQSAYWSVYNTCYDIYFDTNTEGLVYGLWSSIHDAPNKVPSISDKYAKGYFAVSYDGGINWDFSYSSGLPTNSIPVKMSVVPNGDELTIAVATYNNGFYISYDSGRTFENISNDMISYEGMIWGEDIVIVDNLVYCLTSYHGYTSTAAVALADITVYPEVTDVVPSVLYVYDLETAEIDTVDMGDIVIARSLTYDSEYGLYINVIPYYYWGWIDEIQANYYINYGGGVYSCDGESVELILPIENGASHSAFAPNGVMYVTADKGTIYYKEPTDTEFHVYVDGLFTRMKNISFSLDGKTLYATTFGGGTYRMPALETTSIATEYTVTFVNYDGTIISTQTVAEGESAILPANPTREPDEHYHYTFSGWNTSTDAIYSDLTVTAKYVYKTHTEDIQNAADATCSAEGYTGDTICSVCGYLIEQGSTTDKLDHTPADALSGNDGTHTVSCTVCGETISTDSCIDSDGDNYCDTCGYQLILPEHTVTFVNYDGTILSTQTVVEGESAVLPENPTREPDEHYHYTFAGWSASSDYITSDLTVTARYVYKAHTTTTKNATDATCTENGYTGDICCSTCGYIVSSGEIIPAAGHTDGTLSENGDDTHTVYCGVCNDVIRTESCTDSDSDGYCDNCGYKFKVYYTVIFADWDGSILSEQTILEGESAVVPDNPTRESDTEGSYTFAGWDTDASEIQSDMTVTALYTFTAHTEEVRGASEATCTSEGYTGDIYCSECGMLLESGSVISMTDHSSGDAISNGDGTHSFSCTVCETVISTESCTDNDSDGYCDECEYAMNVTKFTSVSSFTNGEQYLITASGYALRSTLAAESVSLTYSDGYYTTADEIPENMLWTYQNGYLYTTYNGRTYYLTVQRSFNSYMLTTTTSSWWASTWSYQSGKLTTKINEGRRQTTRYLDISNSSVSLSSQGSSITLYQLAE